MELNLKFISFDENQKVRLSEENIIMWVSPTKKWMFYLYYLLYKKIKS